MPTKKDLLKKYKEKRNFSKTPEPSTHPAMSVPSAYAQDKLRSGEDWKRESKDDPSINSSSQKATKNTQAKQRFLDKKKRIFCIQEHHAQHLHWDFRLEIDGVMPSWAIPKGPSTDPKVKRLAIQTEDHPISYAKFEGVIPEGEYGAGIVMVWDYGTYKNIREKDAKLIPMDKCLKEGRIEVFLEGKKLQGAYILIRLKDSKKDWLFFKKKDKFADARHNPIKTQNKSVLTNRTITQIKRNENKKNAAYKECS